MLRVLVATIVCCAVPAHADDALAPTLERAQLHYQAGEKLYLLGRYADALREFQDGYALAPRPEFLINLGQAYRKLHDRAAAIEMFEKFLLSTNADDPRRAAVQDVLAELRAEPATPQPQLTALVRVDPIPEEQRWYRDWLGGTLTGFGLAGIAVGGAFAYTANTRIGDATVDLDHYRDARDATTTRTIGFTVLGVGTALVLGGIIRYATH